MKKEEIIKIAEVLLSYLPESYNRELIEEVYKQTGSWNVSINAVKLYYAGYRILDTSKQECVEINTLGK